MKWNASWIVGAMLAPGVVMGACGGGRESGVCGDLSSAPTAQGDAQAVEAEGDGAWQNRGDEAELRKAIESWQRALAIDPARADLRVKLSRAHYFLADGHLRFKEDTDAMVAHFKEGTNQAEMALGQKYPNFRSKFCARRPYQQALQQLDKGATGAMYWYATNLGKYALETSIVEVLNQKDRIKAMMDLIVELDHGYFHFAVERYFGAFYTKVPFPSGDLPRSRSHFEKALQLAPDYLATRVLFAELYATKAKERAIFKSQLEAVLAADLNKVPELVPEATVEKKKAKALLDEIDTYFPAE
jgi:tetratricopeptide (TPR) repeat protein